METAKGGFHNPLVRYYSQATKTVRVVLGAALLALPVTASGQLRVDSRIYASSTSCTQCDLSGKRMTGVTMKNADFSGSLFNNSNLSGGNLNGTDLTEAHFRNAILIRVHGEQVMMRNAVMEDATLTEANLSHSTLRHANLHRAELTRGVFRDNDFQSANLIGASAPSVDFSRSNFDQARLDNADLSGAILDGGRFTAVRFGFADLEGASLMQADLSDADLTQVVGLTQAQLDSACGNGNTRLPAGLVLTNCAGSETQSDNAVPPHHPPHMRTAMRSLDQAITDLEGLFSDDLDSETRARLERVHSDLVQTREAMRPPRRR